MAYDTTPTPEYVQKFAERMRSEWTPQQGDDRLVNSYISRTTGVRKRMDVAEPKGDAGKTEVKRVCTGRAEVSLARDTATITQTPGWHVNPRSDSPEHRQQSARLEAFLSIDFKESQIGKVWYLQCLDTRKLGRGWSNKFPLPRLWAGNEYRNLIEELQQAIDGEADEKEVKRLLRACDAYLDDNYPIRWRHIPAEACWPEWSDERFLPEVVELRRMTAGQIKAEYGEDSIPGDSGATDLDVFVYHNWVWTATLVSSKSDPKLVHEWEHNLGMNPCSLFEVDVINEPGKRWKSPLLPHLEMFDTEDEILSDLRHNHRRNTLAGLQILLSRDARGITDPLTEAKSPQEILNYAPGEDMYLWGTDGEKVDSMPYPVVNPQSLTLLQHVTEYNSTFALNPVEEGRMLSGQAAVGFSAAVQTAQQRLDPYAEGATDTLRHLARLAFRSVRRLNEEFPDRIDKIAIVSKQGAKYEIGPADVEGMEKLIQPRISMQQPMSRNQDMALATGALNLPYHPATIMERYLNDEDPEGEIDRWLEWQVLQALVQQLVTETQARAGQLSQGVDAATLQQLAFRISQLPPEAQIAIQQVFQAPAPQGMTPPAAIPTGMEGAINGQSMSNERREGVLPAGLSTIGGVNG